MNETFFLAYGVLVMFTLIVPVLAVANWRRLGGIEHLVMGGLFYYYSLYGAWGILAIKRGIAQSDALDHLEVSLFAVNVDSDYIVTLLLYGTFDLILLGGIGVLATRRLGSGFKYRFNVECDARSVGLLLLSVIALVISASVLLTEMVTALDQGMSIYIFTRTEISKWFSVHQLLNRVGLIALACGWPFYLLAKTRLAWKALYGSMLLLLTVMWIAYLGALGNRNELVVASIAGFYFYVLLGGRLRLSRLAMIAFLSYLALRTIETLRAVPPGQLVERFYSSLVSPEFWNPSAVAGGSESMAAHVSLYGIISQSVPWTWGSSLVYFLQSVNPFVPIEARVRDSYAIYATAVGAPEGQGFNIHFAAGSYLNFGPAAIFLAAVLLAITYVVLRWLSIRMCSYPRTRIPGLMGYAYFCAFIPFGMRAGPEGMKALLFEGFILPVLVAWLGAPRTKLCGARPAHGQD